MRIAIALAIAASLPGVAAMAQAVDAPPDSVLHVDPAAVGVRTLEVQQQCRAVATKAAGNQVMMFSASSTPPTALAMSLSNGELRAVTPSGKYEKSIFECMADRGYVARTPQAGDATAYRRAMADGRRPDPYSLIVRFEPTLSPVTTVVETRDNTGQQVRTYMVGRF